MKPVPLTKLPRNYPTSRASRAGIDRWAWNMQGEGSGSVLPSAENAFFAMMGSYPAAVLWDSFHGGSSLITLNQLLKVKVWSPVVTLSINGNWSKVQEHFSAAFKAQGIHTAASVL